MVTVGIDPHKHVHVAVAVDANGRRLTRPLTVKNDNGLLRQCLPKGTDLSRWGADELEAVALALNNRPRKTLGWRTPAEALNKHLLSDQVADVATTG